MVVKASYKPGQKGTRKLVKQYGDQLICVRYRYDYENHKKYKTIELIIDEDHWTPAPPHPDEYERPVQTRTIYTRQAGLRVGLFEKELQQKVKSLGATWSREDKLWYLNEHTAHQAGLEDRIVKFGSK